MNLMNMSLMNLPLETQVAQRLIVGYDGAAARVDTASLVSEWLQLGVGGLIFFRETFEQPLDGQTLDAHIEARTVARLIHTLQQLVPENFPVPWMSVDQEGGLIERLPHFLFPSGISPMGIALQYQHQQASNEFCAEVADAIAYHLNLLGFNLNFTPTLDLNINPLNPVIGTRSFGENPDLAWKLSQIVLDRMKARHILSVVKHYPGHGNSTLDSHSTRPTFQIDSRESQIFSQALQAKVPAVMLAHGLWPEIDPDCRVSASASIIQENIRQEQGYQGLLFSDDMCMGAVTQHENAVDAALASFQAGVDVLIYRDPGESTWAVKNALVQALESGQLSMTQHQEALARIEMSKASLKKYQPNYTILSPIFKPEAVEAVADHLATRSITMLTPISSSEIAELLPVPLDEHTWVIHPERRSISHYSLDEGSSAGLADLLRELANQDYQESLSLQDLNDAGAETDSLLAEAPASASVSDSKELYSEEFYMDPEVLSAWQHQDSNKDSNLPAHPNPLHLIGYDVHSEVELPNGGNQEHSSIEPSHLVFIAYNSGLYPTQEKAYRTLKERFPDAAVILISAGTPYDTEFLPNPDIHLALGSYRPAVLKRLAQTLACYQPEDPA
ncbi:MAG: hypothetical protein K2X01_07860 [Cyanobacteria bacterium]|nr:hypothetical protein [Cyanobacteriota bacterium]